MQTPSERPRVGVTLSRQSSERTRQNYLEALERAGAEAVALYSDDPPADPAVANLDALVLSGGGDVNPERYGQEPHESLTGVDDERDSFESDAIARAIADATPILAICRGHQMLNVALGGSLEQHIESGEHRTPEGLDPKAHSAWHGVKLDHASWLAAAYGSTSLTINSRHHQGIREGMLARELRATGWSPDGYIEAYEGGKDGTWLAGVQWHPERVEVDERAGFNSQSAELFKAFVKKVVEIRSRAAVTVAGTRK